MFRRLWRSAQLMILEELSGKMETDGLNIFVKLIHFRLAINYPIMDKHILKSMKRLFLHKNKEILCSKSSETFEKCSKATTVHEFIRVHFPFAGHKTLDDYYEAHNPVDSIPKVRF